ncbi:MAG: F0F1 ATP synthase subunit beta, partial [Selenomonadales bacterium]|nr:F0F1 ATP synthase subunit beta [Selenomonadales bacterium]
MTMGKIVQVVGPVVDIEFQGQELPAIYNAIVIEDKNEQRDIKLTVEVMQ